MLLPGISNIEVGHRDLLFKTNMINNPYKLKCVDDIFVLWGKVPPIHHTRDSLKCLEKVFSCLPKLPIDIMGSKNLRVTSSIIGLTKKYKYSRYELEDAAGTILATRLGLNFVDSHSKDVTDAIWCRLHFSEDQGLVGIRETDTPCHRRYWRTETTPASLHPPVAAAMAMLADLKPGQTIIDPFAGAGTVLIEAGIQCKGMTLLGYDISKATIQKACANAKRANISVNFQVADSTSVVFPKADRVISNPPWEQSVKLEGQKTNKNLIDILLQNLKSDGKAVIITDKDDNLYEFIKNSGYDTLLTQTVRVSGRLAEIIVIGNGPCFSKTKLGDSLLKASKIYNIDSQEFKEVGTLIQQGLLDAKSDFAKYELNRFLNPKDILNPKPILADIDLLPIWKESINVDPSSQGALDGIISLPNLEEIGLAGKVIDNLDLTI